MSQQMTLSSPVVCKERYGNTDMGTILPPRLAVGVWGKIKITDMEGALKDDEGRPKEEGCSR